MTVLGRALFVAFLFLSIPSLALGKGTQADSQCPAGGVVGQSCKDMTNGYVTSGHCTHINVCKADSWSEKPPTGCGSSGNINAPTADCPKGPTVSQGTPSTSTPSSPTTPPVTSVNSTSPVSSSIFDAAFSTVSEINTTSANTVSTTSLNGIEYFISGGEALTAGEPLTQASQEIVARPISTIAIGQVYGLQPVRPEAINVTGNAFTDSYAPSIVGFSSEGSTRYVPPVDFAGQAARLSAEAMQRFSDIFAGLFFGGTQSPQLSSPTFETLYEQASHAKYSQADSTFNTTPRSIVGMSMWEIVLAILARIGAVLNALANSMGTHQ